MASNLTVNVRMYQVGELGDCFLLTFNNGDSTSDVLIDCGSFRNKQGSKDRLRKIVGHINGSLNGKKLDVVVGTHQHNDHVSGFVHCEDLFANTIEQVWLSWLDNPKDEFAQQVKADQKNLVQQLVKISKGLRKLNAGSEIVTDILGFYGIDPDSPEMMGVNDDNEEDDDSPRIPAAGINILKKIGAQLPNYLSPGQILDLPGLPENTVKVYVLGPPHDKKLLFDKDPTEAETFDPHLAMASTFADKLLSAVKNLGPEVDKKTDTREEEYFPFNQSFKKKIDKERAANNDSKDKDVLAIYHLYNNPDFDWRKIDKDWSEQADRLALYLDSYTNNSSLALAFELVKAGKVLLFVGDAQTGNWSSWDKIVWDKAREGVNTNYLLKNTVLYKVGHHASHNATLVGAFDQMGHEEMVAMIPVDGSDANITKKNGWKMPAKNLYMELKKKTKFRVLRMDTGFADECDPVVNANQSKWSSLPHLPVIDAANNFIEYKIEG